MTDIWDEKPKSVILTLLKTPIGNAYQVEEMDAWLDKVKTERDELKKFYDIIQDSPLLAHDDANYIVGQAEFDHKRMKELKEKAEKYDKAIEQVENLKSVDFCDEVQSLSYYIFWRKAVDKLEAIKNILIDVCEDYGEEFCNESMCDCDPSGGEGCLTRKIMKILEDLE